MAEKSLVNDVALDGATRASTAVVAARLVAVLC